MRNSFAFFIIVLLLFGTIGFGTISIGLTANTTVTAFHEPSARPCPKAVAAGEFGTSAGIEGVVHNDYAVLDDKYIGLEGKTPPLPTYTISITATSVGTTMPSPGAHAYLEGEVAQVTAIPGTGYVLDHWELDGVNVDADNFINVTMDADHGLHAIFVATPQLLCGVCSHPWILTERDFQEMKGLGVEYVRFDFVWRNLEPERNASIDFSTYDQFVEWAKAYGIEIVALLLEVPEWLWPPDAWPGGEKWSIPRLGPDFDDFITQFGEFVYAIVDRYKGDITYFEIWNEANFVLFWRDAEAMEKGDHEGNFLRGVAIEKYVIMLQEAYTQAKAANSDCKIIAGGLCYCDYNYVQGMYDYGAKGYFDYLGLHPYVPPDTSGSTKNYDFDYVDWDNWRFYYFPKIQLVRYMMVANEDGDVPIFITELGTSEGAEGPEGATTEEMQADRLTRVFEKIDHDPGYPYISAVMWYQFRDGLGNFGLLRSDYTPRLQYYTYKEVLSATQLPNYTLDIYSYPITGVPFTLDGTSHATPYSTTLGEGTYTVAMSSTVTIAGTTYNVVEWEDGSTDSTRAISLTADMELTAYYELGPLPPTNVALNLINPSVGTHGCSAAKQAFIFLVSVSDLNGVANLNYVDLILDPEGQAIEVRWTESTDVWSEENDLNDYISLGECTRSITESQVTLYFAIIFRWTYPDENTHSVQLISLNDKGLTDTDDFAEVYYVENDLTIHPPSVSDDRVDPAQNITISGHIYYEGTSICPPDGDYQVKVKLSGLQKGSTSTTLISGYYSIEVATESTVGSYIYQVSCNYNASALNTPPVIVDRLMVSIEADAHGVEVGTRVNFIITVTRQYDFSNVTSFCIMITRNGTPFALIGKNFNDALQSAGCYTYSTDSVTDNTYALTTFETNNLIISWRRQRTMMPLELVLILIAAPILTVIAYFVFRRRSRKRQSRINFLGGSTRAIVGATPVIVQVPEGTVPKRTTITSYINQIHHPR